MSIPPAEEIMQKHLDPHDCLKVSKCYDMTLDAMKEFAKLHVEAALKEASEKALMEEDWVWDGEEENHVYTGVDKYSILYSYPLENIK